MPVGLPAGRGPEEQIVRPRRPKLGVQPGERQQGMDQQQEEGLELLHEPGHGRLLLPRRDLLLGLLLLLAVGGWSAWDWWQQEGHLASYRAGLRYAQQHYWDAARSAFLAAAGYADAR